MNSADRMISTRVLLLRKFPFFGVLALKLIVKEDETINTMGTDGTTLVYNPTFVEELTDSELMFVYIHEIMHCVLGHIWRKGNRDHKIWNIACDFAIHSFLVEFIKETNSQKLITMPADVLYDPKFDNMNADKIYEKIIGNVKKIKEYSSMTILDNHDMWGKPINASNGDDKGDVASNQGEEKDLVDNTEMPSANEQDWKYAVASAHQAALSKMAGTMPESIKRLVDSIVAPQKNWRELLADYIVPLVDDYTFNRPDNRYLDTPFYMPSFSEPTKGKLQVCFWIDTSGSVTSTELQAVFSEIVGCATQFDSIESYVGCFDSEVKFLIPVNEVEDIVSLVPRGGGGTSFHAPFKYMLDNTDKLDNVACMVMLTDGYASFGGLEDMLDIDTIWIMTSDVKPPFGKYAQLDI